MNFSIIIKKFIFYTLILLVILVFIFPFIWMLFCSLKPLVSLLEMPPDFYSSFTLSNYQNVFYETDFFFRLFNSFLIAFFAVLVGLILGLPASYALSRKKNKTVGIAILFIQMVPGISLLVPWFAMYRYLGILDTYHGLIGSHLVLTIPLIVWILVGFFEDIPVELEDAARIDGCNKLQALIKVIIPLSKPGIATASILSFILSWNHFLFALILSGPNTIGLPITVFEFITYEEIDFGGMYAASVLITAPIIILVLCIQKQFVGGLTIGGLKG